MDLASFFKEAESFELLTPAYKIIPPLIFYFQNSKTLTSGWGLIGNFKLWFM